MSRRWYCDKRWCCKMMRGNFECKPEERYVKHMIEQERLERSSQKGESEEVQLIQLKKQKSVPKQPRCKNVPKKRMQYVLNTRQRIDFKSENNNYRSEVREGHADGVSAEKVLAGTSRRTKLLSPWQFVKGAKITE